MKVAVFESIVKQRALEERNNKLRCVIELYYQEGGVLIEYLVPLTSGYYTVGPRFSDILGGKVIMSLNRGVTKSG